MDEPNAIKILGSIKEHSKNLRMQSYSILSPPFSLPPPLSRLLVSSFDSFVRTFSFARRPRVRLVAIFADPIKKIFERENGISAQAPIKYWVQQATGILTLTTPNYR